MKNKHGKCLAVSKSSIIPKFANNRAEIIQSICYPRENGQLWRFYEAQLCNGWNKCLSLPKNGNLDGNSSGAMHFVDPDINSWQPKWKFENPGRISDSRGHCLAVYLDSDLNGAEVLVEKCNSKHKGQWWSFDFQAF